MNCIKYIKALEATSRFNGTIPCCEFGPTNVLYMNLTKDSIEHPTETMIMLNAN